MKCETQRLILQLTTRAAAGVAILCTRDAILGHPSARAELKAFNIRCIVGLTRLFRLPFRIRLAAVQAGLMVYHAQRIALFHGLNSAVVVMFVIDLVRLALFRFRSKWIHGTYQSWSFFANCFESLFVRRCSKSDLSIARRCTEVTSLLSRILPYRKLVRATFIHRVVLVVLKKYIINLSILSLTIRLLFMSLILSFFEND